MASLSLSSPSCPHEVRAHDHEAVEVDVALGGRPRPHSHAVVEPPRRHQPERRRGAERRHALLRKGVS